MLLEEGIPLAAGQRLVFAGLDALLRGPDFGPVLLAQIVECVADFQFTQLFPDQPRKRTALCLLYTSDAADE